MGLVVALLALSFASSAEAGRFNDIIVFGFKTGAWGGRGREAGLERQRSCRPPRGACARAAASTVRCVHACMHAA